MSCIHEFDKIRFFKTPESCITDFNSSAVNKITSFIQSCFHVLFFSWFNAGYIYLHRKPHPEIAQYVQAPAHGFSKKTLVICLHSLSQNPNEFKSILREMKQHDLSTADIYIPRISERGYATFDDMVEPIFEEITKWANTPGTKELVLIGISNGARVARGIDAQLAHSNFNNIKKLRFVSIVGACNGSSLANLANQLPVLPWILPKNIAKEMPTHSTRMKQLNEDLTHTAKRHKTKRTYTFFASPHDWLVPSYTSSLPKISHTHNARYAIVRGYGHLGVADRAAKAVTAIVFSSPWKKSRK